MENIIELVNTCVWGIPTLILILSVGLYFTFKSRFFQFAYLPKAIISFCSKLKPSQKAENGVSPYQALCTALAATVGTGNIAGVAGAITLGGPGAIFWMWVCGFLGMSLKCAEAVLAIRYRQKNQSGEWIGGPMYMIENGLGLKWKWLAVVYAFFGVVAAFGVGNATQINAVLGGIHSAANTFGFTINRLSDYLIAAVLAVLIALMLSGGAKRIGKIAEMIVPYASAVYFVLGVGVLILQWKYLPSALEAVFVGAFSPRAVTGGMIGSALIACRTGAARGVFTNEAGMGTASIAHASATVNHPVEQGLLGIIEVFLDTIVICTVTALVILCSGIELPYGMDSGSTLTSAAFSEIYGGWASAFIAFALVCFALATVLGWGYYGLRCAQYLFGEGILPVFVILQIATVMLGAILNTSTVWLLAETVNGLMAIPNLIALLALSPEFFRQIKEYKKVA